MACAAGRGVERGALLTLLRRPGPARRANSRGRLGMEGGGMARGEMLRVRALLAYGPVVRRAPFAA